MKNKTILFLIGILIVSLIASISAYQDKLIYKECILSLNNDSFPVWDETLNQGVFLKIINNNSQPNYTYISYQAPRKYFNNFNTTENYSIIPILNINKTNLNKVYAKCTYLVNKWLLFDPGWFYSPGWRVYNYFTSDFNLSIDVIDPSNYSYLHADAIPSSYYIYINKNISNWKSSPISIMKNYNYYNLIRPYYANNGEEEQINASLVPEFLSTRGFVVGKEAETKSLVSLITSTTNYSRFIVLSPNIKGNGPTDIIYNSNSLWGPTIFFYVNSTIQNLTKQIVYPPTSTSKIMPISGIINATSLNRTGNKIGYGDTFNITANLSNPYEITLENITFCVYTQTESSALSYGVTYGYPLKTELKNTTGEIFGKSCIENITLEPHETINKTFENITITNTTKIYNKIYVYAS